MIFKMRCRVTNVKMNMKGKFENLECSVCNSENESQIHIMECSEISKHKEIKGKMVEHENISGENVKKQLEIVKCFIENMKIKAKLESRP